MKIIESNEVTVEPINEEAFAPFGQLLMEPKRTPRENFAARIENHRQNSRANVALIRSEPLAAARLSLMERHRYSNQLFVPLDVDEYIVTVAHDERDEPSLRTLRAFRVGGLQSINYYAGVWHAHMVTLRRPGVFVMLVHEDGSENDCDFHEVAPISINGLA